MKHCFLFILCVMSVVSCKKNSTTLESHIGEWQWVESTGGLAGGTETAAQTGIDKRIVFTAETVAFYLADSIIYSYNYTLKLQKTIYGEIMPMVNINGNTPLFSMRISGDNLATYDECYDCWISKYKKVQ